MSYDEEELNERIRKMMRETGWDKLSEEELTDAISEQLEAMVKLGMVEQLIGEDGEFYYRSNAGDKFQFVCPNCKHKFNVPVELIGRRGRCSDCSGTVLIARWENEHE